MSKQRRRYVRAFATSAGRPMRKKDAAKAVMAIWDEYGDRLKNSWHTEPFTRTKNETAKYFLRREIYALGCLLQECPPKVWSTSELVSSVRNHINRPDKTDNIFHDLLMSVYDDDKQVDRRVRLQFAQELEYARRHHVPPELLCGFLLQSGQKSEIRRKLLADYVEPEFREEVNP